MNSPANVSVKAAEPSVRRAHAAVLKELPFADRQDFEDAARGFIATLPDARIVDANGRTVWDLAPYAFLEQATAPETVNPSLWRLAQLNCHHGLFRVSERIYQVRGFDGANMTIVEGASGIIVVDTLMVAETARAALALYREHRGQRAVNAVIYTHSHVDHWGGVQGVIDQEAVRSGAVAVVAPSRFMESAVSENVISGPANARRGHYQFGELLPPGVTGHVDVALGKTLPRGTITLVAPTDFIVKTGERRVIDGVEIIFQMTPDTEAPAEMHLFFPALGALNTAENTTHTFHNLLPFRGASVRDSLAWSKYIGEAIELYGERAEVLVSQHHWPVWGKERVRAYLAGQRDLYKFVHDQTLRLMNHGFTPAEIAEQLQLPASLAAGWQNRGYYGTLRHNSKAIYQKYLGWYDANPAHLDPLPPVESAKHYVEYMGGAASVIARAREDFARGEYRFVIEVLNHVVFADPENREARALAADASEQLGYGAEAATWRNSYLTAAQELRQGLPPARAWGVPPSTVGAVDTGTLFDYLGVRLNGPKAEGKRIVVNWAFTDTGEGYALNLENSALTYRPGKRAASDASLTLTRATFNRVMSRQTSFADALTEGLIVVEGDAGKFVEITSLFDDFQPPFGIVLPWRAGG